MTSSTPVGFPKMWVQRIASVSERSFFCASFTSMLKVSSSASTNTGSSPAHSAAEAVARKVKLGTRTVRLSSCLSPLLHLSDASARVSPTVHDETPTAYFTPSTWQTSASNSESWSPFVSMPEASEMVSLSAMFASSGSGGRQSGIFPG